MTFEDPEKVFTAEQTPNKWNEISKLILKQDGDSLRKTMRVVNKEFYDKCEKIYKNIVKLSPRRSRFQNSQFYKINSFRGQANESARNSIRKLSSKPSFLNVPRRGNVILPGAQNGDEIDDNDITNVIRLMKAVSGTQRSDSSSDASELTAQDIENQVQKEDFDNFMIKLKSDSKPAKKAKLKPVVVTATESSTRIPEFAPIGKDMVAKIRSPIRPLLSVSTIKDFGTKFSSQKNIFGPPSALTCVSNTPSTKYTSTKVVPGIRQISSKISK
jgi:hypothetical protein